MKRQSVQWFKAPLLHTHPPPPTSQPQNLEEISLHYLCLGCLICKMGVTEVSVGGCIKEVVFTVSATAPDGRERLSPLLPEHTGLWLCCGGAPISQPHAPKGGTWAQWQR